jgi:hypothetical protein
MSECAEPTTISMPGPFTCSALTVIDPAPPLGELVCSLTMRLMPPGNEIERFGFEAPELDFTTSAATRPPNRLTSVTADWLAAVLHVFQVHFFCWVGTGIQLTTRSPVERQVVFVARTLGAGSVTHNWDYVCFERENPLIAH